MKKAVTWALLAVMVLVMAFTAAEPAQAETSFKVGKATVTAGIVGHNSVASCKGLAVGSGKHVCCWQYAADVYKKIWGTTFSRNGNNLNYLRNLSADERKNTEENLRKFLAGAQPGAVLRFDHNVNMGSDNSSGHSMVVLRVDSDGVWFYEGNYNGKGNTRIKKYTWSALASYKKNCAYIKYIIWPGAKAYEPYDVVDSVSRIGISTKNASGDDQCFIKKTPEEAGDTVKSIAKGDSITLVGAVRNQYGNLWYETSDGYYVYSKDVDVWECSTMFSVAGKFENTDGWRHSHVAPYLDSAEVENIFGGEDVVVTAFVKNSAGNIWAKLDDGSYLCFYDAGTNETKMKFLSFTSSSTAESVSKPEGDISSSLKANGYYVLRGVIKAKAPMLTITSHVINRETNKEETKAGTPITAKPSMSASSVDIHSDINGVNINMKTTFGKIGNGWYSYYIEVQHGFEYDGQTFKFGAPVKVIASEFNVGKGTSLYDYPITVVVDNIERSFTATKTHNAKNVPYADGTTTQEIINGATYKVVQIVANSHGNLWAKLSTGDYVCYHDFEKNETYMKSIDNSSIAIHNIPFGTVYAGDTLVVDAVVTSKSPALIAQCELARTDGTWGICYENAAKDSAARNGIPVGATFSIDADKAGEYICTVRSQYGFTYNGRTFVWEESTYSSTFTAIDPVLNTFTVVVDNMLATFELDQKCNGHANPYAAGKVMADYKAGQLVQVVQIVENSYGNLWAKLSTGDYVCYYDASIDKVHLKCITFDGFAVWQCDLPTGDVEAGATINVSMIIDSPIPVLQVDFDLLDANKKHLRSYSDSKNPDINERTTITTAASFSVDAEGTYYCRPYVNLGFEHGGQTFYLFGLEIPYDSFTVVPVEQPTITGAVTFRADSVPGTPGQPVTVPFYMENPQQVDMGALELYFDLPDGVTIAATAKNDDLTDAIDSIGPAVVALVDASGFKTSSRILDVAFILPADISLPVTIPVTAVGYTLSNIKVEIPAFSFRITAANSGRIPGDATNDGLVDLRDVLQMLKYATHWEVEINMLNADVTADGLVDLRDVLLVLKYTTHWDVELK